MLSFSGISNAVQALRSRRESTSLLLQERIDQKFLPEYRKILEGLLRVAVPNVEKMLKKNSDAPEFEFNIPEIVSELKIPFSGYILLEYGDPYLGVLPLKLFSSLKVLIKKYAEQNEEVSDEVTVKNKILPVSVVSPNSKIVSPDKSSLNTKSKL